MGDGHRFVHWVGGQEAQRVGFQDDAGQLSAEHRAGVDGDAIVADDGGLHRRMAVHDDGAEVGLGIEERLARAQQIVARLVLQRRCPGGRRRG